MCSTRRCDARRSEWTCMTEISEPDEWDPSRSTFVQVSPPAYLDEIMDREGSPDSVMATGWSCGPAKGANKRAPASLFAEAKGGDSTIGHEKFAWDCEARFAELYAQGELDESESVGLAPQDGTPSDFVLPASGALAIPSDRAACPWRIRTPVFPHWHFFLTS